MKGRDEFEKRVHERMERTGEDYSTASRVVSRERFPGHGKGRREPEKPAVPVVYLRRPRSNRPPPMGGAA